MYEVGEKEYVDIPNRIGGYRMIDTLRVGNFRCFKKLDLQGLKRINIIVGKNAAGKTALLEAIKLGLDGTPQTLPFLNQWRNIPTMFTANQTAEQFKGLFSDFFYNFDTDTPLEVRIGDSAGRAATVRLLFDPARAVTVQATLGFQNRSTLPSTIVPLVFDRSDFQGQKSILLATVNQSGQPLLHTGKQLGIVSGFVSSGLFGSHENATWLSQMSIAKRSEEVVESLRRHFPFIHAVTSESVNPGAPATVYADLPSLSRKIPLSLVSGGISRLFTLMLAVVTFKAGVVLVDEIENGIFHDQYAAVWKTLIDLAEHHQTQLFISTHSKECLKDAVGTIAQAPAHFTLLRARREREQSTIELFGGEQAEAALEKNGEVRD